MLTKEFINGVFATEIQQMTIGKDGIAVHPFIGFSLVCQSIEVLGACFDEYDWENRNLSELRFRLAISKLFDPQYQIFNSRKSKYDLYKNLRCPMIHQMRPGMFVRLSERKHEIEAGVKNTHLSIQKGALLLIYEDLFDDFKNACQRLVMMIEKRELKAEKVYEHNISVPKDNLSLRS